MIFPCNLCEKKNDMKKPGQIKQIQIRANYRIEHVRLRKLCLEIGTTS